MNHRPDKQSVRRIVLPSGRMIEVVRFHEPEGSPNRELHICPRCSSDLVQPITWSEAADERWEMMLECPNCWWSADGLYSREQVHAFEDHLEEGLSSVLADLKCLAHANMADQVETFVAALHADKILPEDF